MTCRLVVSARAALRLAEAEAWLASRPPDAPILCVAASLEAAGDLLRDVARARGALFGCQRATLSRLASTLAAPALAARGLAPVGGLSAEALVARTVFRLGRSALGRYAPVADRPGLSRALASTIDELRHARVDPGRVDPLDPDLARVYRGYLEELELGQLADRALVLALARDAAKLEPAPGPLGVPLLLLDLALGSRAEVELCAALAARAPELLATAPAADPALAALETALRVAATSLELSPGDALGRLQRHLFEEAAPPAAELDGEGSVRIFSAPGESRECVEIARRILAEVEGGVRFDEVAVLVHAGPEYRRHLAEALGRARIPAHAVQGDLTPDPAGRAFLALLGCAAEGLSAGRFAEYLSLGEVPGLGPEGAPPEALPSAERWVPPDDELAPEALADSDAIGEALARREHEAEADDGFDVEPEARALHAGTLRSPRRWEQLLLDAAVIGGEPERWSRRLAGLSQELAHRLGELDAEDDPAAESLRSALDDLSRLRAFALPLVARLAALPARATWGEWLELLEDLATRALRRPQRVLATLAQLRPMAPVAGVDLTEVRIVLGRRLTELLERPGPHRYGRVLVGPPAAARGMRFEVVFVPGLAERLFPRKIVADPILPDPARATLARELPRDEDRVAAERLALRIAVGAARTRVYLSYPRIDLEHSRPRVPSFYALELLRAARGRLPGLEEMARLAEQAGAARLSWPAPASPAEAIDEAERDLALLEAILQSDDDEQRRALARDLLGSNPQLGAAAALRSQRWSSSWSAADGLRADDEGSLAALAAHQLGARAYSPTALQSFAACPYRFLLHAVHRFAPREVPEAIDRLNPLQRGGLIHEIQFQLFRALDEARLLPVNRERLPRARGLLASVIDETAARYRDLFAPAIERVWEDGIAAIRTDLSEWLERAAAEPSGFVPWRFELSFGLSGDRLREGPSDPHSTPEPALLACGLRLRGKIDLCERDGGGRVRVTDHKTGKAWVKQGMVVNGGQTLQPVLYALAAERLFPDAIIESGRLYYCTLDGKFSEVAVSLDGAARAAATTLARALESGLARGFLPALPLERACETCDFRRVCGPYEEQRTARKERSGEMLERLAELRGLP